MLDVAVGADDLVGIGVRRAAQISDVWPGIGAG